MKKSFGVLLGMYHMVNACEYFEQHLFDEETGEPIPDQFVIGRNMIETNVMFVDSVSLNLADNTTMSWYPAGSDVYKVIDADSGEIEEERNSIDYMGISLRMSRGFLKSLLEKLGVTDPKIINLLLATENCGPNDADSCDMHTVTQGINAKGLNGAQLALQTPSYEDLKGSNGKKTKGVMGVQFLNYALGKFESTKDLVEALKTTSLVNMFFGRIGDQAQIEPYPGYESHFSFKDSTGASIVLEIVNKEIKIHENKVGVMANNPTFDWHLTNLQNYKSMIAGPVGSNNEIGKLMKRQGIIGEGTSGIGAGYNTVPLPGDFSGPSRFAMIWGMKSLAEINNPPKTVDQALVVSQNIINRLTVPVGTWPSEADGLQEFTIFGVLVDQSSKSMFVRTYNNAIWRRFKFTDMPSKGSKSLHATIDEKPKPGAMNFVFQDKKPINSNLRQSVY